MVPYWVYTAESTESLGRQPRDQLSLARGHPGADSEFSLIARDAEVNGKPKFGHRLGRSGRTTAAAELLK